MRNLFLAALLASVSIVCRAQSEPILTDTQFQTSADNSRITVFAFNVPQPEVSVEIHCRSTIREKMSFNANGGRVETLTCEGKSGRSDDGGGDLVGSRIEVGQ